MYMQMCAEAFSWSPQSCQQWATEDPRKRFHSLEDSSPCPARAPVFGIATIQTCSSGGHSVMEMRSVCFPPRSEASRDAAFPSHHDVNSSHETFLIVGCDVCQAWMISVFFLLICCFVGGGG